MSERRVEISRGASKHISKDLKPEARKALNEEDAWDAAEQIFRMKVNGYPESFSRLHFVIRDYHKIRWDMKERYGTNKEMTSKELALRLSQFMSKYSDEAIDGAKEFFGIITQLYSK